MLAFRRFVSYAAICFFERQLHSHQIGHAWEVVQKHYEYPGWSEQVQNGPGFTFHFHPYAPSSYFDEDDDEPLSEDEAFIFFQQVLFHVLPFLALTRGAGSCSGKQ